MIPKKGDIVKINPELDLTKLSGFTGCYPYQDQVAGSILDVLCVEEENEYDCLTVWYKSSKFENGIRGKGRGAYIMEKGYYYDIFKEKAISDIPVFLLVDTSMINKTSSCPHSDIRKVYVGTWIDVCHDCKEEIK